MAGIVKPSKPKITKYHAKKPKRLKGVKKVKVRTVVLGS
jgi:hypothetical protein